MASQERDPNAWRRHEVPTYIDTPDTFMFGLPFARLAAIGISCVVGGGGAYGLLYFLPWYYKALAALLVTLFCVIFIAVRPGNRSLLTVLIQLVTFSLRTKHYSEEVRSVLAASPEDQFSPRTRRKWKEIAIPIPLPNNTLYLRLRIPLGKAVVVLLAGGVMFSSVYGCGLSSSASAQSTGHYTGKRVYLQSIVVDLSSPVTDGGQAAVVRLKSASKLRLAEARLNESVQSVTERRAHGTAVQPAVRFGMLGPYGLGGIPIAPVYGIGTGEEFAFESVYLRDARQIRPFCDIGLANGQFINRDGAEGYFFRHHTNQCRLVSAVDLGLTTDGITNEFSITKPDMSIQWQDIKRNQGALDISGAMLPYPGPSLYSLEQELEDLGAELLNWQEICDARDFSVMSMGVQTDHPDDPGPDDYFEGRGGQRVAGVVKICDLEDGARMGKIGLPQMVVFAQGNADYEIAVRAIVTTLEPENVVNRARLFVLDKNGSEVANYQVPLSSDGDYDPDNPNTVKFNVAMPAGVYEDKVLGTELDSVRFQLKPESTEESWHLCRIVV